MRSTKGSELLTVAAIRPSKRGRPTEFLFNERQQIFTFRGATTAAAEISRNLKLALKTNSPVRAALDAEGAFVRRIEAPSKREIDRFNEQRGLLERPDKTLAIDVASIDPTKFNVVGRYLKFPTFRLCTRVVPNYTIAKKIFDYCASQSCSLPGPYGVAPCIPFQYVIDGCYARAHKMRWIITKKFRYCCDKVFSFANQNSDVLSVQANKWGGCCVTWWYHVAPLIRMKLGRFGVLALVIDPGMFNKPVLLSTWLAAQENSGCNPAAKVSMYSIQPGSAYGPANYAGTAFSTDDLYTATDATLTGYKNGTTCP
jgi:hypothetical protein